MKYGREGVGGDTHIEVVQGSGQLSGTIVWRLSNCSTYGRFSLCDVADGVHRFANLFEHVIAILFGRSQLRMTNKCL